MVVFLYDISIGRISFAKLNRLGNGCCCVKKDRRIQSNQDFQLVFKKGDSFANRQFVLYFLKKEKHMPFRIGLSVSTKVGNAVKRNQIKRYLKQAFFELDNQVIEGYDFVVIARNPAAKLDFFETKKSIVHLLWKTNLLVKNQARQSTKKQKSG